jgi:plastocyanin
MNKILALGGALLILATGAGAVGLLDGGGPASATTVAAGAHTAAVPIAGFAFKPAKLVVSVGARVTWTNEDSAPHTATADQGQAFDTGTLMQHQSRTVTFRTAGTFTYHCAFHPFMTATVTVR